MLSLLAVKTKVNCSALASNGHLGGWGILCGIAQTQGFQ